MRGQWVGRYQGTSNGLIVVNADEYSTHFGGVVHLIGDDRTLPDVIATFQTANKDPELKFRTTAVVPVDRSTGMVGRWDQLAKSFPEGVRIPQHADVLARWDENSLNVTWTTDLGTTGNSTLPRSRADVPSLLVPIQHNWAGYKDYVAGLEGRRYVFRGQRERWRLRTSFHRSGRADLQRFRADDLQALHKHLSARTKHVFNLDVPNENGAFLNLVQHHGYPTPLLDWTYSPFVAAFFAFRSIERKDARTAEPDDRVRIHVFDQAAWRRDFQQLSLLDPCGLHVSIGEFLAIENERLIPQQAATTVTNVDDIEAYVASKETQTGKAYLSAIDLPKRERDRVMNELRFMGITAGSLFPGLDGACEELKDRNFDT
jgi:hypothetical protein